RPAYFPETSGLQLRAPRKSCRHLRRLVFSPRQVAKELFIQSLNFHARKPAHHSGRRGFLF
ncbi:MAG: hypothetical protein P8Y25_10385, partial [Chromatiaceae bacterium]